MVPDWYGRNRGGKNATKALRRLIAGNPVVCQERDVDRYGRIIAVCLNAEGQDVGPELVRLGWALAYRRFSDDYVGQEGKAQEAHLGMWRGRFVAAWDWRRGDRLVTRRAVPKVEPDERRTSDDATGPCLIKGNISSRGERIYHVPGGAYYSRTKISPAKGERFFCSEAEAEAAGWRRSQR